MLLSVLSALARLDIDPWQEAADLARLPRDSATQRLATLITNLPGEPSADLDLGSISVRLIALLPSRASTNIAARETSHVVGDISNARAAILMYVILSALMLGSIIVSRQPPAQFGNAHTAPSPTVSAQIPPPTSGQ